MDENTQNTQHFQKKVYTRLSKSDLASLNPKEALHQLNEPAQQKKIVATTICNNLKEEFKKNFVPTLIEIFELRQAIANHQLAVDNPLLYPKSQTSIKEIVNRLKVLQKEIEEAQRWCEGVALQISKGLYEAEKNCEKDLSQDLKKTISSFKSKIFLKKIFKFFERKNSRL